MTAPILPVKVLRRISAEDRARLGKAGQLPEETRAKAEAVTEREIQNEICAFLSMRGYVFSRPAMHKRSTIRQGWPDITLSVKGRAVALEVKAAKGKLSPEQQQLSGKMISAPNQWIHGVDRSLAEAKTWIDAIEG